MLPLIPRCIERAMLTGAVELAGGTSKGTSLRSPCPPNGFGEERLQEMLWVILVNILLCHNSCASGKRKGRLLNLESSKYQRDFINYQASVTIGKVA
ncbi:hypothetical protein SK128_013059, partial [Halocaridina rubra]